MAAIGDIVHVTIDDQTTAIQAAGFGLPMFLGLGRGFTTRYKEYGSLSEVAVDFQTASNEYKFATAAFGQDISVEKIAIGRQDATLTTITPTVQNSATYTVKINDVTYTYASDSTATAAEIVTGLTGFINADSTCPVTASGSSTLILTQKVAGTAYTCLLSDNLVPVYTTVESLTAALNAVQLESNDFYGVTCYSHVKADVLEVAAWVESNYKLGGTSSNDVNIINTTAASDTSTVAYALKAAGYKRTFLLYSADAAKYPEAAWMGGEFARDAGEATWMFKQLNGITVDNLTASQRSNALAKNCNIYVPRSGVNMTENGKTSGGKWIDVVRDEDWLKNEVQVEVYSAFINSPKIAQTDKDSAIIEARLRGVISRAVDNKVLADDPAPTIFIPKVKNISANNKANRYLPDIKITGRLAGAWHETDIELTIQI